MKHLTTSEPTAFKGGMIAELMKDHSGPADVRTNYRGISISDMAAKMLHSCLRRRLVNGFAFVARDSQFGGIAKRGTSMCRHFSASCVSYCRSRAVT